MSNINKVGRKRDDSLEKAFLEAAINILAEVGFDSMTMDMVAASAKASKATVYRRWSSKPELVRDALIFMSKGSIDLEKLPDTGTLKNDLLALLKPHSIEYSERKLRVLAKLGSFFSEHQDIANEALNGIFEPWTNVNKQLMKRAQDRGEISKTADIDLACEIIIGMTSYRSQIIKKMSDKTFFAKLIDHILMPALKKN